MKLEEIIARNVPAATLERVVTDQSVLSDQQRSALFKAGLSAEQIGERVVAAYGSRAHLLADGLHQQMGARDWDTAALLYPHFADRGAYYNNQQASLVGRIPNLPLVDLGRFLDAMERQVCLVVCRHGASGRVARGTGFLIDKDLVLTCRHVLRGFPTDADPSANGNRIEVYFDFHRGEPVEGVNLDLPGVRRVSVATQWHVDSGDDTVPDGLMGVLTAEDEERIKKSLDFMLLRLSEPVGLQPIDPGGGRRRGWIKLPPAKIVERLQKEDWIIIPQHPNGMPLRIDLGRFHEADQTKTRIRYDTNTAPGTSGAPCFNQKFYLVGIHNASVPPVGAAIANQAIRWDLVEEHVRPHVLTNDNSYTLRWSISRQGEKLRVILGREELLEWIKASAAATPRLLKDRVYAAHATVPAAGCSFSSDVLHAEIRESKSPRAVYGQLGQQMPATAEDFLHSLLRELEIEPQKAAPNDPMPVRPGATTSANASLLSGEVDKLDRWLADELPSWLGRIIDAHLERVVDAREAATALVTYLKETGQPIPDDVRANSEAPQPVPVRPNTWQVAYVVIDDLRVSEYQGSDARTVLRGEVQSLIAALVKGKSEDTLHSGLRRLRWMFLGYLPDFIAADRGDGNGAVLEYLQPEAIGEREVFAVFTRMFDAQLIPQSWYDNKASGVSDALVLLVDNDNGPDPRLLRLQRNVSVASEKALRAAP